MSDRTRTTSLVRLLLVAALFAAVLSVAMLPGMTALAKNPGVAGSWQITVSDASGETRPALATFDADGTLVTATLPVTNAGPDMVAYESAGHGAWTAKGGTDISFTFMEIASDGEGHLVATLTLDAQVVVDKSGDKFDGIYVATATAPDGTSLAAYSGTLAATRITVQPMPSLPAPASPAAPPAASPAVPGSPAA